MQSPSEFLEAAFAPAARASALSPQPQGSLLTHAAVSNASARHLQQGEPYSSWTSLRLDFRKHLLLDSSPGSLTEARELEPPGSFSDILSAWAGNACPVLLTTQSAHTAGVANCRWCLPNREPGIGAWSWPAAGVSAQSLTTEVPLTT